jgi:DNA-directed RNA polymerase subunit RPC12/RpoP
MADHTDPPPVLRCRNCGHRVAVEDAPPADSPEAGRCPNCGQRSLILATDPDRKSIKIN